MFNSEKLIKELTLEEKIQILSGYDAWYTHKIERLQIPRLKMSDGPNGVRGDGKSGKSSACFPCAISVGSTWNMELVNKLGKELGNEAKAKAVEAGNAQIQGIAEILEGYYFAETALVFGDIPFSEVNSLDFPDPVYESQATVMNGAIALIQSGIQKAGSVSAANNVFSTSSTWSQVGNALLARYNLAMGNNSAALAAAKAANFTSTANDWDIIHTTTNYMENLFWMFEVEERQDYLRVQNSYMSDLINPASSIYSGNAKTDESGRFAWYVDQSNGVSMNTTDGFAAVDRNYPVVSFEEVQLIIAETAVGTSPDEALAALNAVRASNNSKYGGNFDPYTTADFAAGGMVNRGLSTSAAMTMEIMIEKFKSVIGGPTYHDVRRNNNLIGTRVKNTNTNVIPQRFFYPASESSSNENFPGLIDQFVKVPIFN